MKNIKMNCVDTLRKLMLEIDLFKGLKTRAVGQRARRKGDHVPEKQIS